MTTHKLKGGCHCGNIIVEVELARSPSAYNPRACDCAFCRKHGASYVSDPHGSLLIQIKDECFFGKYHQGSGIAECLLCTNCGVLVGIVSQSNGQLYGTVNSKVIDEGDRFGEETSVSPRLLSDSEKTERWKGVWFANVNIGTVSA